LQQEIVNARISLFIRLRSYRSWYQFRSYSWPSERLEFLQPQKLTILLA